VGEGCAPSLLAVSTRVLIVAALLCGLAILLAFTVQVDVGAVDDGGGPGGDRGLLVGALGVYLVVGLGLLPSFDQQLDFDQVAYIELAQRWSEGDVGAAISGHWSPMFSLLVAPFSWLGVDPQLAGKLVDLAGGGVAVVLLWTLVRRWGLHPVVRATVLASMVPLLLVWVLAGQTGPDVLSVATVLAYLLVVDEPAPSRRRLVVLAAVVALGTLVKAYLLPFFVAHLVLLLAWRAWGEDRAGRRRELRRGGVVLGVAALALLPWVLAVSVVVGSPTFSTGLRYNVAKTAPDSGGHPIFTQLMAPESPKGTTAWEDLDEQHVPEYTPWSDADDLRTYTTTLGRNLETLQLLLVDLSLLAPAVLVASVAWFVGGGGRARPPLVALLLVVGINLAAYLPVFFDDRYLWPAWTALVLLAGLMGSAGWAALAAGGLAGNRKVQAAALLLAATWILCIAYGPAVRLWDERGIGEQEQADDLAGADLVPPDARVAAIGGPLGTTRAARWCYRLEVQCYGGIPLDVDEADAELEQHGITHLLVPEDLESDPAVGRDVPLDSWAGFEEDPALSTDELHVLVADGS
jgi:hypothetical protein